MPSREVRVAIVGDPSSLQRALQTSETGLSRFQSRMTSISTRMRSVGSTLTRSLTLPLVGFGFLAARELQAGERAMGQTRAVIESMGIAAQVSAEDIATMASEMHELSGLDDEGLQEMLNTLLTFRNVVPIIEEAGAATHDLAAFFGGDMQQAATQVGRALNNPLRGLSALTRRGVEFTEAQRSAVEQMMAFGNVAGAQQIILQELGDEFGGQAQALGETVGGRFNRLKNDLEELGASILEDLMPALESLAGIIEDVAGWFDRLTPTQQRWVAGLIAAAFVIGPLVSTLGALAAAIGFLASPIGLVIVAVAALAAAIVLLVINWDSVSAAMSSFVQLAISNIPGARTAVMNLQTAIGGIRTALSSIIGVAQSVISVLAQIGSVAFGALMSGIQAVGSAISAVVSIASNLFGILQSIASFDFGAVGQRAAAALPGVGGPLRALAESKPRSRPVANRGPGMAEMKQAFREALREEVQMVHVTNAMGEVY